MLDCYTRLPECYTLIPECYTKNSRMLYKKF